MRLNQKSVADWIKRGSCSHRKSFYDEWAFILCVFSVGACFIPPRTVLWSVAFLVPAALIFPALLWGRKSTRTAVQRGFLQAGLCSTYSSFLCLLTGIKIAGIAFPVIGIRIQLLISAVCLILVAALWLLRLWALSWKDEELEERLSRLCMCFGFAVAFVMLAALRYWGGWYEKRHPSADGDLIFFCGCLVLLFTNGSGGTLMFLKSSLLARHPDKNGLVKQFAPHNAVETKQQRHTYEKSTRLKRGSVLLLALVLFMSLFLCVYSMENRRTNRFHHYADKEHIARIELVFVDDVASDEVVTYTAVQEIGNDNGCIRKLRNLPLDKDMLMPKAVRRVREQAYVFKLTYNDGCWELVDAAGRFVVPSAECGPINGQSYWHDGGPAAFKQDAFDALAQKYLSASLPAEDAEA